MEKYVVVYDNGIGEPFLLKSFGNQVLLLSPGLEVSRLRVNAVNWNNDILEDKNDYESKFNYLCMTGEQISANSMFSLLMLVLNCGDYESVKSTIEKLANWGIGCPYEPVNMEISVFKRERNNDVEYCYAGEGFMNIAIANPNALGMVLGFALSDIMRTSLFPEINLEIRNASLDRGDMSSFEADLMNMLNCKKNINVTFKNKEKKYGSVSND
jgi:hypothetical protein